MAAQTAKKNNFGASTIQIMGDDLGYAQEEEVYEDEEVVRAALCAPLRDTNWEGPFGRERETFRGPFQFASERVRAMKAVALLAMERDGLMLRYASSELRGDREVVHRAVTQNGDALSFASKALDADRDIVLSAVRTAGDVLQFASEELKADAEIVLTAVSQNGFALETPVSPHVVVGVKK